MEDAGEGLARLAIDSVTVNASAKTVSLTLATGAARGDSVLVSYTDPTTSNDQNAIQDTLGNDAASFVNVYVTNNTADAAGPLAVPTILSIISDTGSLSNDFVTNQPIQTVRGTLSQALASGEKVQVSADGVNWFDGTAAGTIWLAPAILSDANGGANSLTVRTIDQFGNFTVGAPRSYIFDELTPSAPTILIGNSQGAAVTLDGNTFYALTISDATPTISGTAEPGARVVIYLNGVDSAEVVAGSDGAYTYTAPLSVQDGQYGIYTTAVDAAGNESLPSDIQIVTVDTVAVAGTLTIEDLSSGFGSPLNTSDPTFTLVLAGQEAGSTVTYQYKLDATDPNVADVTGWTNVPSNATSLDVTGVDGLYQYRAQVVDAAGNTAFSNIVKLNVTATPPTLASDPPPATALTGGGNSIGDTITLTLTFDSAVNGLTSGTDNTIFKVAGAGVEAVWSGVSGTTTRLLTYTIQSGQNGQATIDEAALKAALVAGITNEGGIAFAYSANGGVIPNIDAAALPVVDGTVPTIDTVTASWGSVLNGTEDDTDGTVTVATTGAEDGQQVTLTLNGLTYTGSVSSGSTTITVAAADLQALTEGQSYALAVDVSDAAGNAAVQNTSTSTGVDRTAPTIDTVTASWGSALSAVEDDTDGTVTVATTGAEDGQQVTLTPNGLTYTGSVSSGSTTITVAAAALQALTEGQSYALAVDVSDAAGNAAVQNTSTSTGVDRTAPMITSTAISSATGGQNSLLNEGDVVTITVATNEAVVVTGTPTITLIIGATEVLASYEAATSTSTSLKFNYTILAGQTDADGIAIKANSVAGTITDAAGNALDVTAAAVADNASYKVDTTAPAAPTIDVVASSDNGASSTNNISSIATPQVVVTLGAGTAVGDVVTLKAGTTTVGTFTLTSTEINNGNVTITSAALGGQATYDLTAFATDAAGNVGGTSNTISYVLDTTNDAPSASFVSARSTSITILASDPDAEPNWSTLTLVTPVLGANTVNDGTDTIFNVGQQVTPTAIDLSVTDLTNTTPVTVGGSLVTVALGTSGANTFDAADGYGIYYGFGGSDTLSGGDNGNTFIGGSGSDTLNLGTGVDVVLFDSLVGVDTVNGFVAGVDVIKLAKSVMTGLGSVGALTAPEFESGAGLSAAVNSTTRIFYNQTSGALFYDADGSGGGAAVQLANFTGAPNLTVGDLFIV